MRLTERHLEIPEHAVFDDRKRRRGGWRPVIVEADRRERARLRAIGDNRHQLRAKLQPVEHLRFDEGGAGEIRLPAENPVEFGGVTDGFMDR